ncbi:hypothetical protein BAE44_0011853 [Dichanthelium oligosanthes]|uniref:DUF1618 domain-containing protein n=1 Tax=Dichanthelium oligosanthes TaxID=888268 RepID=A0A1E5VPW9_9POAL|nr:hypothetical protein BAE44_0011853 [Dichanthelium oligosanthes]
MDPSKLAPDMGNNCCSGIQYRTLTPESWPNLAGISRFECQNLDCCKKITAGDDICYTGSDRANEYLKQLMCSSKHDLLHMRRQLEHQQLLRFRYKLEPLREEQLRHVHKERKHIHQDMDIFDASPHDVECSVTTPAKGRVGTKINSFTMHVTKYSSVRHRRQQMEMLLSNYNENRRIFACLKYMEQDSIFDMDNRINLPRWLYACKASWISKEPKSESLNARTVSQFHPGEKTIVGRSNGPSMARELTENESLHHRPPPPRPNAPTTTLPGSSSTRLLGCCENATTAKAKTSAGHDIAVSFSVIHPPGVSRCFVHCPDLTAEAFSGQPRVTGADGALLLIRVTFAARHGEGMLTNVFVYRAGPGKPSLCLVPRPYPLRLYSDHVGALSCGEHHFFVVIPEQRFEACGRRDYDLHVFSSETMSWSTIADPVAVDGDKDYDLLARHEPTNVMSIGGGRLGWVDLRRGVLLCNVVDDKLPEMRLIQLPSLMPTNKADFGEGFDGAMPPLRQVRDVTCSNGFMRFVEIEYPELDDSNITDLSGRRPCSRGRSVQIRITGTGAPPWTLLISRPLTLAFA